MKLKNVCILLLAVLFFLLLSEITCIANNNHQENLISDEDRRAAEDDAKTDQVKSQTKKRGLYPTPGAHNRHQSYPSGYGASAEAASFSSSGYYGVPTGHYLPASGYGASGFGGASFNHYAPTGGSNFGGHYAHSGHGGNYEHGGHGGGYGHNALALKGLLIPLAGIALLGAAAALSTNPVLLQLGVVNGRRRRDLQYHQDPAIYPANPVIKPSQ